MESELGCAGAVMEVDLRHWEQIHYCPLDLELKDLALRQ